MLFIGIPVILIVFGALAYIGVVSNSDSATGAAIVGEYDDFAKCLTESGAKMYGAYWCPHCKSQKEMFGSSFQYINYIECAPGGDDADPMACQAAGISGYPTWIINGQKYPGSKSLEQLSELSGCQL